MRFKDINYNHYLWIILGVLLLYLSSMMSISLPNSDIPITGQSFMVLLIALLFPRNLGLLSVLFYIILGSIGLPIFADGMGGIAVIRGKSGGYIYGFLFATWVIMQYRQVKEHLNIASIFLIMIIGTAIILLFGVVHLSLIIGMEDAVQYGLKPYLLGAGIKIIFGTLTAYIIIKYFKLNT